MCQTVVVATALFLCPFLSQASGSLKIAVAANFMLPFREIAAAFEKGTGVKLEATYASTGSLYAQIMNGAPYDVFLSADEKTPRLLFEKGAADKPVLYAAGRVVLWGDGKSLCRAGDWREALQLKGVRKIAIANPVTAPYGAAAEAALKKSGQWGEVTGRLVVAQNVGQSFQYAVTGGTDGCFCALSSALSERGAKGCYHLLEEAPPILQAACLLSRTSEKGDVRRFLLYLNSSRAAEIKKRYGYHQWN
jgi:molybdate transport system substrate-binding protein